MNLPAVSNRGLVGRRISALAAGVVLSGLTMQPAAAAQTKSWVVSWFTEAMYSQDGDCSGGLTPLFDDIIRDYLKAQGKTQQEADDLINNAQSPKHFLAIVMRGVIDGKPVNIYANPTALPYYTPRVNPLDGKFAYGFNLDGKGAATPHGFEDPETHEQGVNNQLVRATGCIQGFRATRPEHSLIGGGFQWASIRDSMPAWLISVTGDDLTKDGDVTVTWGRALDHVTIDAKAEPRADSTFQIDPDPRWHNEFHGKLKGGVITIEPGKFHLESDPYFVPVFDIRQAHLRLQIKPDGSLDGIMGGYQSWEEIYWSYANGGYAVEYFMGFDIPSLYRSLKELADGYPDPVTGENTQISVAYRVEAIPAFVVPAVTEKNAKTAQAQPVRAATP